jgi:hypothetical protein
LAWLGGPDMVKVALAYILVCLLCIPSSLYALKEAWHHRKNSSIKNVFFTGPLNEGPITIFIHGTKQSLASRLVHAVNYSQGLVPVSLQGQWSILGRLGHALHQADPEQFNIDSLYLYVWIGKLTFKCRRKAAHDLYALLRHHKGPITLIGHSHGCNLALMLAEAVQKDPDPEFKIDRLILLACPVQQVTAPYVSSPVFKRIYSFYSTGDLFQIADPQAVYLDSRTFKRQRNVRVPIFSERTFPPTPNLIQVRIVHDKKSPGHLNFLLGRFLNKLPATLKLVDQAAQQSNQAHFIVNIPRFDGVPHFINIKELRYIPRRV